MTPATFQGYFERPDTPAAGSPVGVLMLRVVEKNPGIDFEEARVQAKSLPPQAPGRNDRHDIDRRELKLLTAGHYVWAIYKKECGKSGMLSERRALSEALRQVWDLKAELRRELKAERAVQAVLVRERFEKAKLPPAGTLDMALRVQGAISLKLLV